MNIVCKNCNRSFSNSYIFCPYCGQTSTIERLNFHHLVQDIIHELTHADKGVLLLFKELIYRPGKVARQYVEGKRKIYFNPFSFLVLMVGIALFFILKFEAFFIPQQNLNAYKPELLHFAFKYFNVFIFIMCPVNALLIWLFFKKHKMNYVENLVLSAYISGQTMLFYCIVIPFFLFKSAIQITGIITGCLLLIWFVTAILQFYKTRSAGNIGKAILAVIISQFLSQALIYLSFDIYNRYF